MGALRQWGPDGAAVGRGEWTGAVPLRGAYRYREVRSLLTRRPPRTLREFRRNRAALATPPGWRKGPSPRLVATTPALSPTRAYENTGTSFPTIPPRPAGAW